MDWPPFILRDTDGDFEWDSLDPTISVEDGALFLAFPYRNLEDGMSWQMAWSPEHTAPMHLGRSWENGPSGVYFDYIPIFIKEPGETKLLLTIDGELLQELEFEVIE